MPELPEVETIRLGLARHVWGRTVAEASVLHPRAVRRQGGGAQETVARLTGCTFGAVDRRGKYLWLPLAEPGASQGELPGAALLVHLGMSGQLLVRGPGGSVDAVDAVEPAGEAGAPAPPDPARHLRVRLRLDDGGELWFVDQRTFGHVMVADLVPTADGGTGGGVPDDFTLLGDDGPAPMSGLPLVPAPVSHIARDLLDPALELSALVRATRARRTEVKRALLDQSLVSGIGNIYADEALWRTRLHGRRATDALAPARARELYAGAGEVLREAVAAGGTSFDELYVDVDGAAGYFARDLAVYGREGLPCRRCGRPIRREAFMNRSSFSCPSCQRKC